MRGRCFRCLSSEHRVVDCHGKIRCLSCRQSGHRERDCWRREQAMQAPLCSGSPAAGPRRPLDRSWASVAAPPVELKDREPNDRVQPVTSLVSTSTVALPEVIPKSIIEEQSTVLRAELQGMVASQPEEMIQPLQIGRAHV